MTFPTSPADAFSAFLSSSQAEPASAHSSGSSLSGFVSPYSPSTSHLPYLAAHSPPLPSADTRDPSHAGPSRAPSHPHSAPAPFVSPISPGPGLGHQPLSSRPWEQISDGPGAGHGSDVLRWPKKQPSPTSSPSTGKQKRKPRSLALDVAASQGVGEDEERSAQREVDRLNAEMTPVSAQGSTLSEDMQDLSLLRRDPQINLEVRPLDSPLHASVDSGSDCDSPSRDTSDQRPHFGVPRSTEASGEISVSATIRLLGQDGPMLIVDLRPIGDFLESHLPRSANLSIPTLMLRRFRKAVPSKATTWEALGGFVSTPAGKAAWDAVDPAQETDLVLIGMDEDDAPLRTMKRIFEALASRWKVQILQGGRRALRSEEAEAVLVSGELSQKAPDISKEAPLSPSAGPSGISTGPTVPTPTPAAASNPSVPRVMLHHPSMPSLRDKAAKRGLPPLTLQVPKGPATALPGHGRKAPPPALKLHPPRSATLDTFGSSSRGGSGRHPALTIDVGVPRAQGPQTSASGGTAAAATSPFLGSSVQALCHAQSKLPPSPTTFSDVQPISSADGDAPSSPHSPFGSTAKADGPANLDLKMAANGPLKATRNGFGPFIVSTILPKFLYLGPEISSQDEVNELKKLGVQRILNVAIECNDDEGLHLNEHFERYLRIPIRDIVEESNIGAGIRESCQFLDDARLHSQPTYVHCKAGKSRSVTVVLAYLIHANAWTLKTSYAYVAERRKGISPNIGFVAELMQFEESELGVRQSGGISGHRSSSAQRQDDEADGGRGGRPIARHMRDSLPPAWSGASFDRGMQRKPKDLLGHDDSPPAGSEEGGDGDRRQAEEEREVRKDGHWVHSRRAPVDRQTLQPGRRASKAGLESLRSLSTAQTDDTDRPSPQPTPTLGGKHESHTPGTESRVGWI